MNEILYPEWFHQLKISVEEVEQQRDSTKVRIQED